MSIVREILEGWANDMRTLSPQEQAEVERRASICTTIGRDADGNPAPCENFKASHFDKIVSMGRFRRSVRVADGYSCAACGCPMSKKFKSPSSMCPVVDVIFPADVKEALVERIGTDGKKSWIDVTRMLTDRDGVKLFSHKTTKSWTPISGSYTTDGEAWHKTGAFHRWSKNYPA